jgi:hypothetical protein
MSDKSTNKMIQMYRNSRPTLRFMSGFFRAPPENYYTSQTVEYDIERSDESVAAVQTDMSTGYEMFSEDQYTNKKLIAPVIKEASPLNVFDLIKREAGNHPFVQPEFVAAAIRETQKKMRKLEDRTRRNIEWQAAQILQTAKLTLYNSAGTAVYTLDYKPKATHFPTANGTGGYGAAWNDSASTPAKDIVKLSGILRTDGLWDPTALIFGETAFEEAFSDPGNLKTRFQDRRLDQGTVSPFRIRGRGGQYRGVIDLGNYKFDVWTYNGHFKNPNTGLPEPYMNKEKVVCFSPGARFDATFGAIPRAVQMDPRMRPFVPRTRMRSDRMDLHINAWTTPDGEQLIVGIGSRPLLIPTAIDTFGCIST